MHEKTVLITGCSSGIGRATAELFLAEGWRVYATAREKADIESLGEHEESRLLELDVTVDGDCKRAVNRVIQESGRIDCLVNNAGYGRIGPIEDLPIEEVQRQFDVNVYGPHRLTRRVVPHMREQGTGTVVNLSSVWGRISGPGVGAYAGSKAALEAMTDALRAEVDEYGVDAVLIGPGPVATRFYDRAVEEVREEEATSGAYDSFRAILEDIRAVDGPPGTVEPERVAEVIVEAACSPNPAPRYRIGPWASLAEIGRLVPAQLRDRIYGVAERLATR